MIELDRIELVRLSEDPFARIPKASLADPTLSWKAKGLLAFLCGKQGGDSVTVKRLEEVGLDGRDSVKAGLRELREAGYASLSKVVGPDGKIVEWVLKVSDMQDTKIRKNPNVYPETDFPLLATKKPEKHQKPQCLSRNGFSASGSKKVIKKSRQIPYIYINTKEDTFPSLDLKPLRSFKEREKKEKIANPAQTVFAFEEQLPKELNTSEFRAKWEEWLLWRKREKRKAVTPTAARMQLKMLSSSGVMEAIGIIDQSMGNDWTGLFPLRNGKQQKRQPEGPVGVYR